MSPKTEYDTKYLNFDDIRRAGKVVPYKVAMEILQHTEPVISHLIRTDGSEDVEFEIPQLWNMDLKDLDDSVLTSFTMSYNDKKYRLTKRAALTLTGMMGLSDRYVLKLPGNLLEPHVRYWFSHEGVGQGSTAVQAVTKDDFVVAFMPPNSPLVSNLEILEQVRKVLASDFKITDLYVDPRVVNNFVETSFRIIFPKTAFKVSTVRKDVEETDSWHFGIYITNSLTGSAAHPLTISGFMVEESELAGLIPEYSQAGRFDRSRDIDLDDLRGWVHSALDQIMAVLPVEAEMVKAMALLQLAGKIGPLTTDLFRSMKVPRKVQEVALENLTVTGDLTAYGLMHSMAAAASMGSKFNNKVIHHVQQVCGSLPHRTDDICGECGRLHLFD